MRREKILIPYTPDQFRAWLRVVLEDTPFCEYCNMRVDIMTISPDHRKPFSRGGSLELKNLAVCDDDCNRMKGELLPGEFKALLKGLETFTAAGRADVQKRLKGGILHFGNKKKDDNKKPEPRDPNLMVVPAILAAVQRKAREH